MLKKPLKVFAKVAKFIDQKTSASQLKTAINASSFQSLRQQEEKQGFIEKTDASEFFFRKGTNNQWKDVLATAQVERIINGNRGMMEKFNYIPAKYK